MFDEQLFWNLMTIVAACGAAFGGAKYALKSHETRIANLEIQISKTMLSENCRNERIDCRSDRESTLCELNRKIDRIFIAIEDQEKKRESGKDQFNSVVTQLTSQVATLKAILDERGHARTL